MSQLTTEPASPRDWAPSDVRAEAPTAARVAGAVGLFLLTAGVVAVIAQQYGRGLLGEGLGYLFAAVGVAGLFVHASRDIDVEVRRLYGLLAALLLLVAVVVSLYPHKAPGEAERHVGSLLMPWGVGAGLLSLIFFIPFARHETEEPYRSATRYLLLAVGAALTIGAVFGGLFVPAFLVGPGILLALLGLGFVAAYLGLVSTDEGLGYRVAVGLGVLGAIALLAAFGRSIAPTVLHEGPSALKSAAQTLDPWLVTGRVISILIGLAIAALALRKRAPLWLRGAAAVVGLAIAAVFIVGSFSAPIITRPAPFLVPYGLILGGIGILYVAISVAACTDNPFVVLTRRELAAYFHSPIAYLVLFAMAFASGLGYLIFALQMVTLTGPIPEPIVESYWPFGLVGAILAMCLVPALTMRLFSEEKRTGTLEVLLTAPVNEAAVVLSKFVASWIFFMLCWLPAGLYLIALRVVGGSPFDYRPILSFYLALGASGAAFLAMGLFFSSVTRNQVIAFVLTFAGMMFLLLTYPAHNLMPRVFSQSGPGIAAVLAKLNFLGQWEQSLAGQLPVQNLIVELSVTVFWLFLTLKVLEARRWS
jgi:ABC-type transport system involved in multi-copper enzyme maturation permease subunit